MAKLVAKDGKSFLELSQLESNSLNSKDGADFELLKAKDGLFLLNATASIPKIDLKKTVEEKIDLKKPEEQQHETKEFHAHHEIDNLMMKIDGKNTVEEKFSETPVASSEFFEIDSKIFGLLKAKTLSERVEGNFEKLLSKEETSRLNELVKEGKVLAFKLNESYKKAVYKLPEFKKESEAISAKDKLIEEYSLEQDGFLIAKNEERAKRLSQELSERIKNGEIKGIKSFDGNYYIVENALLEKYRAKTIGAFKEKKSLYLSEVSKILGISRTLAKIACDFLKEDGELLEKKKDLYQYID